MAGGKYYIKISGDYMNNEVEIKAQKVYKKKLFIKIIKVAFLLLLILISIIYLFLYIIYAGGRFTVTLDKNMSNRKSVFLSEDGKTKNKTRTLAADTIEYMDNISIKWLPDDIDTEATGAHNGDNYIAYTFYIENEGKDVVNYWYSIPIDDVILNVDEAIRVMVYLNGERIVYAKLNGNIEEPEEGTKAFYSDDIVMLESRQDFSPGDIDKFTIVVFIEGDDPDCTNALLGGEMKMHMDITEEHID